MNTLSEAQKRLVATERDAVTEAYARLGRARRRHIEEEAAALREIAIAEMALKGIIDTYGKELGLTDFSFNTKTMEFKSTTQP